MFLQIFGRGFPQVCFSHVALWESTPLNLLSLLILSFEHLDF